jgi:hypothetical protein
MVVMGRGFRHWWNRFDAFGRKFMDQANPILGPHEKQILEDLQRRKSEKGEDR